MRIDLWPISGLFVNTCAVSHVIWCYRILRLYHKELFESDRVRQYVLCRRMLLAQALLARRTNGRTGEESEHRRSSKSTYCRRQGLHPAFTPASIP